MAFSMGLSGIAELFEQFAGASGMLAIRISHSGSCIKAPS
jgi:hypothetical protein